MKNFERVENKIVEGEKTAFEIENPLTGEEIMNALVFHLPKRSVLSKIILKKPF